MSLESDRVNILTNDLNIFSFENNSSQIHVAKILS